MGEGQGIGDHGRDAGMRTRREDSTSIGPWFRLCCDILWDDGFQALSRADRSIFIDLIALAKLSVDFTQSDDEVGTILAGRGRPMGIRRIAQKLDLDPRRLRAALKRIAINLPDSIEVGVGADCPSTARQLPDDWPSNIRAIRLTSYAKRQYNHPSEMPHSKAGRRRSGAAAPNSESPETRPKLARPPRPKLARNSPAEAEAETDNGQRRTLPPPGPRDASARARARSVLASYGVGETDAQETFELGAENGVDDDRLLTAATQWAEAVERLDESVQPRHPGRKWQADFRRWLAHPDRPCRHAMPTDPPPDIPEPGRTHGVEGPYVRRPDGRTYAEGGD
jgi:hypothetical protein